jgi:hypothetical protein
MKTDEEQDPETKAIIVGIKGGEKAKGDGMDEGEGDASEEAKMTAAEDLLQAFRDRDATAIKDALEAFYKAC